MEQDQHRLIGGRYRLHSVVGRGGMGTVWQAHDEVLTREVAVKEVALPPGLSQTEREVLYTRTFREARASARLSHPGVVTVHDVIEEEGRPWLVMELVPARSLQQLIDEGGPLSPRRVAEIGRQTLDALRHAHRNGILHRDVKPANVLITRDDRAVLTDFGIAQMEGDAGLTQTGLVMGSPAYIPPERAQGDRAVPASDLWAFGATLYAAVEGQSPYERHDSMASLTAVLSEPVPEPRRAGPLREVLNGLLVREPRFRMTADQALPLLIQVATQSGRPVRPTAGSAETRIDRDRPANAADGTVLDGARSYRPQPQALPPPQRESLYGSYGDRPEEQPQRRQPQPVQRYEQQQFGQRHEQARPAQRYEQVPPAQHHEQQQHHQQQHHQQHQPQPQAFAGHDMLPRFQVQQAGPDYGAAQQPTARSGRRVLAAGFAVAFVVLVLAALLVR